MKKIAILHTVQPVLVSFPKLLQEIVQEKVQLYNMFDDFLALDPAQRGVFTLDNRNRLYHDLKSCELTGADLIVVSCSTLTPIVQMLRPLISVPVIAIDDAMTQKAVTLGTKIKVLATAQSTVEPTIEKLHQEASLIGRTIQADGEGDEIALAAMKRGDMSLHDKRVLDRVVLAKGYDCIILAQASMAHLEQEAHRISSLPVLSSPTLCCQYVRTLLKEIHS